MNNRERVLAALRHQQPDRAPYDIHFTQAAHARMAEFYGDPNFDSKALNEVGFRRDQELTIPVAEFASGYEHVASHELSAEAEGHVQDQLPNQQTFRAGHEQEVRLGANASN